MGGVKAVALNLYRVVTFVRGSDFESVATFVVLARNSERAEELVRKFLKRDDIKEFSIVEVDTEPTHEHVLGVIVA